MSGRNIFFIFIALALVFVASNSLFVIKETERGVLLRFGEVVKADLQPGLQFKIPIVNEVRKFDGRLLTVDSTPERFFHTGAEGSYRRFLR
jgi:membrane protease subunit HflC